MFRLRVLGLRVQLSLLFSLFALVALLLLGTASSRLVASRATDIIGSELGEVAAQVADELDRSLGERLQDLVLLSEGTALRPAVSPEAVRGRLEALKVQNPSYLWIGLLDPEGRVQVGTSYLLEGAGMDDRPWFPPGLQGPFVVDIPQPPMLERLLLADGSTPPRRLVALAVPVEPEEGDRPSGVLAAFLDWRWTEGLAQLHLKGGPRRDATEILIAGRDGRVLSGVDEAAGERLPSAILQAAEQAPSGFLYGACAAGQRCLLGYARLPGPSLGGRALDWIVAVRQPLSVALDLVDDLSRLILLGGIAIAVALCLLGWVAAGHIAEPLHQLSKSAQGIAVGETEAAVPAVTGYKEVQTLALVLHRMLAGGTTARVTISLGVAAAEDETVGIDNLVGRADEALYRAKAQGRNRVAVG